MERFWEKGKISLVSLIWQAADRNLPSPDSRKRKKRTSVLVPKLSILSRAYHCIDLRVQPSSNERVANGSKVDEKDLFDSFWLDSFCGGLES